jgi:toxin ParE1/3/4
VRVVILPGAEQDVRDIKRYISKNFGSEVWRETYGRLKQTFGQLKEYPLNGRIIEELEEVDSIGYREAVSGMNRVIYSIQGYSIQGDVLYVHIVTDTRRDMKALLARRLLRM